MSRSCDNVFLSRVLDLHYTTGQPPLLAPSPMTSANPRLAIPQSIVDHTHVLTPVPAETPSPSHQLRNIVSPILREPRVNTVFTRIGTR